MSERREVVARPRPRSVSELPFKPRRRMVSWFNPLVLGATALRDALAATFGTYADKRDQQAALPVATDPGLSTAQELWIDLTGDLGEAFEPTYAVAWHMAQSSLTIEGSPEPLPRADLLVLVGDEVYPTGSIDRYENQTLGPYEAAFPLPPATAAPMLYALPGNHDWYDGLTSFLRVFCQRRTIGGWKTNQTRSYFSIPLPHGWWVWGLDTQLGGWLDQPQLAFFEAEAARMTADDRLILVVPEPFWCRFHVDPHVTDTLDWFRANHIPDGVRVALYVTGDNHHYAHYATVDGSEHRVTVGGAGSFTHPTHHLPDPIDLVDRFTGTRTNLELGRVSPDRTASWARSLLVLFHAFFNPVFSLFLGTVLFVMAWLAQASLRGTDETVRGVMRRIGWREAADGLVRSPLALLVALVVLGCWTAFSRLAETRYSITAWAAGFLHGLAQVALAVPVMQLVARLTPGHGFGYGLAFAVLTVVIGGVLAATLAGVYLLVTHVLFGMHDNEVFSSLRLRSFKCFIRVHLDGEGRLTVYPIGIRHVRSGRWKLAPDGAPTDPWFSRPDGVTPLLLERPFVIE